jgi:hypothetical protein
LVELITSLLEQAQAAARAKIKQKMAILETNSHVVEEVE